VSALLPLDEAHALVLEHVQQLEAETVAPTDAAGRVLAQPVRAEVDLPPFASSAMDGFAIRRADLPGPLPVVARIAAGRPAPRGLRPGEAMAIATGGVVPEGADAVVPIELAEDHGDSVVFSANGDESDHIRPRGGDVAGGDTVLEAGERLGTAQLAALAAAGVVSLECARRPRVAVLVTGSELRSAGEPLGPGELYDSNGLLLELGLRSAGAIVDRLPAVPDDLDATRAALEQGLGADVLVTSGGVSVGPHDLVRRAAADLGVEEVFWRVAVRPGRPIAFGTRGRTLVFGLPGNPVSTLVGLELFVKPALEALQGQARPGPHYLPGVLVRSVRRSERDALLRAWTEPGADAVLLHPLAGQESHMIVRAAAANALVLVPRGTGELAAGSAASYIALS
jgi:molybdopterin molybdotransferase